MKRYRIAAGPLVLVISILVADCSDKSDAPQKELTRGDSTASASVADTSGKAITPTTSTPEQPTTQGNTSTSCERNYTGKLDGRLDIRMKLCRKKDRLTGSYQYVKYGKDITLQGTVVDGGAFTLDEFDAKGNRTGTFTGNIIGEGRLQGTWSNPAGDKEMPFTVLLADGVATGDNANGRVDFTGSWEYEKDGYSFTLDLVQSGSKITGSHCGVTLDATRVDCGMVDNEGETSITGTVSGKAATVTWTSFYSEVSGTARITHRGDLIDWKITKLPSKEGDFFLAMEATLKRVREKKLL